MLFCSPSPAVIPAAPRAVMNEFTLNKDIEVAYSINSSGIANLYIDGKIMGTTSYDTSLFKFTDTMTIFAFTPDSPTIFNGELNYLMVYNIIIGFIKEE